MLPLGSEREKRDFGVGTADRQTIRHDYRSQGRAGRIVDGQIIAMKIAIDAWLTVRFSIDGPAQDRQTPRIRSTPQNCGSARARSIRPRD